MELGNLINKIEDNNVRLAILSMQRYVRSKVTNTDADLQSTVDNLALVVGDLSSSVNLNTSEISQLHLGLNTIENDVANNATSITTLSDGLNAANTAITNMLVDISSNTSNISTNTSNISTNTSNISTNATGVSGNADSITALSDGLNAAVGVIGTNTSNISDNTARMLGLRKGIFSIHTPTAFCSLTGVGSVSTLFTQNVDGFIGSDSVSGSNLGTIRIVNIPTPTSYDTAGILVDATADPNLGLEVQCGFSYTTTLNNVGIQFNISYSTDGGTSWLNIPNSTKEIEPTNANVPTEVDLLGIMVVQPSTEYIFRVILEQTSGSSVTINVNHFNLVGSYGYGNTSSWITPKFVSKFINDSQFGDWINKECSVRKNHKNCNFKFNYVTKNGTQYVIITDNGKQIVDDAIRVLLRVHWKKHKPKVHLLFK